MKLHSLSNIWQIFFLRMQNLKSWNFVICGIQIYCTFILYCNEGLVFTFQPKEQRQLFLDAFCEYSYNHIEIKAIATMVCAIKNHCMISNFSEEEFCVLIG